MISLAIFLEPVNPWSVVSQITTPFNLAAFALAAVLVITGIVMKSGGKRVPVAVWILIPLLVGMPIASTVYQQVVNSEEQAIYRVRITIYDPQDRPLENAKVTASFGGEPKEVSAGWEIAIPAATVPKGEKLRITATKQEVLLKGQAEITLGDERNPTVNLKLTRPAAGVRGQVVDDRSNRAIAGARVSVVGGETEAAVTTVDGNFVLDAQKEEGQQVLLHVEAKGYKPETQWHPAGEYPATIRLKR